MSNDEEKLESITAVLVATARGDFSLRAPRDFSGDSWDILAFLANETAEEVARLVQDLGRERQELVAARDRLHQAEKLAALGELAGGVAHELNQPLTVIQTLTDLLLARPESKIVERQKELELIQAGSRRMGRIVDSIRTFGHGSPVPHHTICLSEPIREALALLGDSLRSAEIEVAVQVSDEAPAIRGNSELLQQVFINLLSNSRDALTFGVTKRSRRIEIELCPHAGGTRAIVRDTGPGVPPEHVQRIFDPFYTTKAIGRGTGLGLAISHGIVTDHRGNLSYRDADSGGAEFVADFPAAEAPEITAGPHP